MKANYKVVNNRQAQLKKVIWDFKPTGACAFLMFRYYVMKMMAATDSAKEQGVPLGDYTKLEVEDSVNEFLRDAKDDAISNYVDPMWSPRISSSTSMARQKSSPKNSKCTFLLQ